MSRQFYLDLARRHVRVPVGTDLVLKKYPDYKAILGDGIRLARLLIEAADTYHTPLVFPVMDLLLEKAALLQCLDLDADADTFHFDRVPDASALARCSANLAGRPLPPAMQANVDAVRHIATRGQARYVPVGMAIGPVSLLTKLLSDPITPLFMAGSGATAAEDEDVRLLDTAADLALQMVLRYVDAQIDAGAAAIFIAEPAANMAYFSPRQIEEGSDVWERYVMAPNRHLARRLEERGVDLIFHCCGELTAQMVADFGRLHPAMLSLGSSRRLWEDAALVPNDTVLYGNLPTKLFYSDENMPEVQVVALTCRLAQHMQQSGHPFILGSECDVLSVPGSEEIIARKVAQFLTCKCA